MQLCQGSMLNYCNKTLDEGVTSHVKSTEIMWQMTCGLDFLYQHKIDWNFELENVLFWKRNSQSSLVVVKLTGFGYNLHKCEVN